MDLGNYDTREKAAAGVTIDLTIDGEVIYGDDDKPVTFSVKGVADSEVHGLIIKQQRNPAKTPEEIEENDMKLARVAITGWSDNFLVHGEKYPYSKSNIDKVMGPPKIRRAVLGSLVNEQLFMNGS